MEKYRFMLPPGISASEEIIFRFCGESANVPICSLLIRAGYKEFFRFYSFYESNKNLSPEEWADLHSEEWDRYNFFQWREFKNEVSEEIGKRKNDKYQLKKYIASLLSPFISFNLPMGHIQGKIGVEVNFILENFPCCCCSTNDFITVWQKVLNLVRPVDEQNNLSLDDYKKLLEEKYCLEIKNSPAGSSSEVMAFYLRKYQFPVIYAGAIAGCLLENGAPVEYMQYQKMCGISLVAELSTLDISFAMNWTTDFVRSYNPKTLCDIDNKDEKPPIVVKEHKESARVSFGEFPKNMPEFLKRPEAVPYWEEAFKQELIDEHFNFKIEKCGTGALVWFTGNMYLALTGHIDIIDQDDPDDKLPRMEWKKMKRWEDCKECDYASTFRKIKKKIYSLYDYRECIRNIFIGELNGQKDGEEVKK